MSGGEEGGPFVDAPHLSAGSVTMQGVEASPFMAGSEEGGAAAVYADAAGGIGGGLGGGACGATLAFGAGMRSIGAFWRAATR